ncbi:MAG TPA: GatB/YqeY domain-containing protein [Candidatus Saccharimonadales bacterium]|nr:GatB/YqeY domain-containing protein [Candidatus Saccharimonadales bacterium]
MTKQQLQQELKQAMLSKDTVKTSVLRMVISAIGYYEIQKGGAGYEATEEDVQIVIEKEAKKIKDSIEQFRAAGRTELVDKETGELEILKKYLPEQMTEEEIKKLVIDAIATTNATSPADMGKVMGALMTQTKGKADGGTVSKIVKEELSK